MANSGVRDEGEIRRGIERAEFVKKGKYAPRLALLLIVASVFLAVWLLIFV